MLIKRQTSETADFFGLSDRGRLTPGLRADVNLIDYDRLQVQKPNWCTTCRPKAAVSCRRSTAMRRPSSPARKSSSAASTTGALPGRLVRDGRVGEAPACGGIGTAKYKIVRRKIAGMIAGGVIECAGKPADGGLANAGGSNVCATA